MQFFDIKSCPLKGCVYWRQGDECAKDGMHIPPNIQYLANTHDSTTCKVRGQIGLYRLDKLLED